MPDAVRSATSSLNVAIDAHPLLSPIRSGIPYYVEALVQALLQGGEKDMRFFFTGPTEAAALYAAFADRGIPVERDRLIPYRSFYHVQKRQDQEGKLQYLTRTATDRLEKKVRKTLTLPPRTDKKIDVYHHTDYVAHDWVGLKNCLHVTTIHDMIPVRFPEKCHPDWLWFAEQSYAFAKTRADIVITVSESSKQDILEHLKLPADKIHVIPLAVRPSLLTLISPEATAGHLAQFGVARGQYILAVGRIDPLKNLERLVEAFARIANSEGLSRAKLVLTGPRSDASREDGQRRIEEVLEKNGLTDRCIFTGFVSDEQLSVLMRNCLVFAYPSLFEGFGLPVLEALAQGAAVITSNVSSLPEVAGDAAVLVDPYSVDAIAEALQQLGRNPMNALALRQEGPKQAAKFSWERVAAAHRAVYKGERP